jgi:hypothetical protein
MKTPHMPQTRGANDTLMRAVFTVVDKYPMWLFGTTH